MSLVRQCTKYGDGGGGWGGGGEKENDAPSCQKKLVQMESPSAHVRSYTLSCIIPEAFPMASERQGEQMVKPHYTEDIQFIHYNIQHILYTY